MSVLYKARRTNTLAKLNDFFIEYRFESATAWPILKQVNNSHYKAVLELDCFLNESHVNFNLRESELSLILYHLYCLILIKDQSIKAFDLLKKRVSHGERMRTKNKELFQFTSGLIHQLIRTENPRALEFMNLLPNHWDRSILKEITFDLECQKLLYKELQKEYVNSYNFFWWQHIEFQKHSDLLHDANRNHLHTLENQFIVSLEPFQSLGLDLNSDFKRDESKLLDSKAFNFYTEGTSALQSVEKIALIENYKSIFVLLAEKLVQHARINSVLFHTCFVESNTTQIKPNLQKLYHFDCLSNRNLGDVYYLIKLLDPKFSLDPVFVNNLLITEAENPGNAFKEEEHLWDITCLTALRNAGIIYDQEDSEDDDCDLCFDIFITSTETVLQESICQVLEQYSEDEFRGLVRLNIQFDQEQGQGKGVIRSWFVRILDHLLSKKLNIFYLEEESQIYNFNLVDEMNWNEIGVERGDLFHFIGIFLTLMFRRNIHSGVKFASHILRKVFRYNSSWEWGELAKELDQRFYMAFKKHQDNADDQDEMIDERFHFSDFEAEIQSNIGVYLLSSLEPNNWTSPLFLQRMLCGAEKELTLEDFESNMSVFRSHNLTRSFLWKWIREANSTQKRNLFQFITARTAVPIHGLQSMESKLHLETDENAKKSNLPTSRTCFNQICFPLYDDYDTFRAKLNLALSLSDKECLGLV